MPRPKVKPQDRRRSVRACLSCKLSKIRCDGQAPCHACIRRSRRERCMYATPTPSLSESTVVDITPEFGTRPRSSSATQSPTSSRRCDALYATPRDTLSPETTRGAELLQSTKSRTLLSSKGEKLFVGAASSLSFLQFVRQVVQRCAGPCAFTETTNCMLEISPLRYGDGDVPDPGEGGSIEQEEHLIESFLEVSSGILDLCTEKELLQSLQETWSQSYVDREQGRTYSAVLLLVLAIGAQCQASTPSDQKHAASYFTKAQKLAFEGFLCDPSIDLIRTFMLMAFYMLGACHRNAACMYLGVAAKAASTLGLHQKEQYSSCTLEEARIRLRCWRCLRVMDTLVSTILGRSSSVSSTYSTVDAIRIDAVSSPALVLDSMYRLCNLLEEIQTQLLCGVKLSPTAAESLLAKLATWTHSLPADLRCLNVARPGSASASLPGTQGQDSEKRKHLIGACHVACSYYFSVALLTRPFLITHLLSHLQSRSPDTAPPPPPLPPHEARKTTDLAQACVSSATLLSRTCISLLHSSALHANMCILKAWVFAAGLLLGFSLFAEDESAPKRAGVETAFRDCCAVLDRFAGASPQAEHYLRILGRLGEAVTSYHRRLAEERDREGERGRKYVYEIFAVAETQVDMRERGPEQRQDTVYDEQSVIWENGEDDVGGGNLQQDLGSSMDDLMGLPLPVEDEELDAMGSWAAFMADVSVGNQAFTTFF